MELGNTSFTTFTAELLIGNSTSIHYLIFSINMQYAGFLRLTAPSVRWFVTVVY